MMTHFGIIGGWHGGGEWILRKACEAVARTCQHCRDSTIASTGGLGVNMFWPGQGVGLNP